MSGIKPETYVDRTVGKAYLSAILATLSIASGIVVGFMWKGVILGSLKKYDYYNEEECCNKNSSVKWSLITSVIVTLIVAGLIVSTVKIDAAWLK